MLFFFNKTKREPLYPEIDTSKTKEFQQFASSSPATGRVKGGYIPAHRLIKKERKTS